MNEFREEVWFIKLWGNITKQTRNILIKYIFISELTCVQNWNKLILADTSFVLNYFREHRFIRYYVSKRTSLKIITSARRGVSQEGHSSGVRPVHADKYPVTTVHTHKLGNLNTWVLKLPWLLLRFRGALTYILAGPTGNETIQPHPALFSIINSIFCELEFTSKHRFQPQFLNENVIIKFWRVHHFDSY